MVRAIAAGNNALFGAQRRVGGRDAVVQDLMQMRLQEKKREMQIREMENERVKLITERIDEIRNSDMEHDLKQNVLRGLNDQINQIYENRAERELMAAEREMLRQKVALEEATSARDELQNNMVHNGQDAEGAEKAAERDMLKSIVGNAINQERITMLKQAGAGLAQEAGHIARAIRNDSSTVNDFRRQSLEQLNLGIVRTDAAINQTISSMYRDSVKMQEEWLGRQDDAEPAIVI
ncbi:MAG: hypothetical protein FWE34_06910 [Defluviitaleaceae bacterium]|nr:hypothetical protein [Defluviitaleaceae bacterium]